MFFEISLLVYVPGSPSLVTVTDLVGEDVIAGDFRSAYFIVEA